MEPLNAFTRAGVPSRLLEVHETNSFDSSPRQKKKKDFYVTEWLMMIFFDFFTKKGRIFISATKASGSTQLSEKKKRQASLHLYFYFWKMKKKSLKVL